jgi:hypothetical protein
LGYQNWFHIRVRIGHGAAGQAYVGSFKDREPMFTPELEEALLIDESAAKRWVLTLRAADYSDVVLTDTQGNVVDF